MTLPIAKLRFYKSSSFLGNLVSKISDSYYNHVSICIDDIAIELFWATTGGYIDTSLTNCSRLEVKEVIIPDKWTLKVPLMGESIKRISIWSNLVFYVLRRLGIHLTKEPYNCVTFLKEILNSEPSIHITGVTPDEVYAQCRRAIEGSI